MSPTWSNSRTNSPRTAPASLRARQFFANELGRASRSRGHSCRWARNAFLAAQPRALAETTAQHRRAEDHARANLRAPRPAVSPFAYLGGHQSRASWCRAPPVAAGAFATRADRALRPQYRRGHWLCGGAFVTVIARPGVGPAALSLLLV